jgi:phage replication-related protein YjqB (UPF0714/DUF867 family)
MADQYKNYDALKKDKVENKDYSIAANNREGSNLLVIAPHGGKIESGTSEIAKNIAGDDYSLYLFEGTMSNKNGQLHITSHKFDEPRALELCESHEFAIGVHGRKDNAILKGREVNDTEMIFLGGLDSCFIALLKQALSNKDYRVATKGHEFLAQCKNNICNRCATKKGAQIEIPYTLRCELCGDSQKMGKFSSAIRDAIRLRVQA